jgi:ApbE superfamily uncharacterized protein (UPF0280 family)
LIKKKKDKRNVTDRNRYRRLVHAEGLVSFGVTVKETDLLVLAGADLSDTAREIVLTCRYRLEEYLAAHRGFLDSLEPLQDDPAAPALVRSMLGAGRGAGVGPMAAVAGAIAEEVGRGLSSFSEEVVVENGGDLFLLGKRERTIALYTGDRRLKAGLGLRIRPGRGTGIGTSSGRIGHSLSFGEASTATVISPSAAVADAAATAVGNEVRGRKGIDRGIDRARSIPGVTAAVIVHEGGVGAWGDVELTEIAGGEAPS